MTTHTPGKYDDACTQAREQTNAACIALIVLSGDKGHGFSVQTIHPSWPSWIATLPVALRNAADQIEKENYSEAELT